MMTDALVLGAAALAGAALGAVYFGALWWTVAGLASGAHGAPLVALSALVRTALAVAGLYVLAGGQWQRLLAGLGGFATARALALRLVRAGAKREGRRHAP